MTLLLALLTASTAAAQTPVPATLGVLQRAAADADPRVRQLALEARQTELRLQSIAADRKPALRLEGRAQHQSDVPSSPVFAPPRNTADTWLGVEQRLFDASLAAQASAARAALEETRARIAVALYGVRSEINEAYFGALDAAERVRALDARIAALEALHAAAQARVREGAALPGEARAIEAALLERRRDRASLDARRAAAIARLSQATGMALPPDAALALPLLDAAVEDAAARYDGLRARPEFTQFDRARDRLAAEAEGIDAARKPRVSAFGRVGYGRPGLNFLADRWDAYWLGGVQLQWSPVTWGRTPRDRETLDLEREIVSAEEAAFAARLARTAAADLADVARLDAMLAADIGVVALRQAVERETRIRWEERVIPLQEYLDRSGELLDAELTLAARHVELAAARARFLTTLGLEVR
ncbi:MAG TPA: TolC family protein [Vicinamibacterales bacterium]